eukprot:m.58219 g.58219  ORF g.58219 m.58219 type:complete len:878 (+) comp7854_c0_seq1:101-2734(+)
MTSTSSTIVQELIRTHGKELTEFVLGCIAGSRDGMTFEEMMDVCSLNDIVLNEQFLKEATLPSVRRLNKELLQKLWVDLLPHLEVGHDESIEGLFVLKKPMNSFVRKTYLSQLSCFVEVHKLLGEFFSGIWADEPKPFTYSDAVVKKFSISESARTMVASRHVVAQPLQFPDNTSRPCIFIDESLYNVRKVREEVYHLIAACEWESVLTNCLGHYIYLQTLIKITSIQDVLEDFSALPTRVRHHLQDVMDVLKKMQDIIQLYPHQLASQLAAHLLPQRPTQEEDTDLPLRGYLSILLECARLQGQHRDMALIPRYACEPHEKRHSLKDLQGHEFQVQSLVGFSSSDKFVSVSDDATMKIWSAHSREVLSVVKPTSHWIRSVCISDAEDIAVVGGFDETIMGISTHTDEVMFRLAGHSGAVNAVKIFAQGSLVLSGSEDGKAIIWRVKQQVVHTLFDKHEGAVNAVEVIDERRVVTAGQDAQVYIWDVDTGDTLSTIRGHAGPVSCVAMTTTKTYLFTGGTDTTIRVYKMPSRQLREVEKEDALLSGHGATVTCLLHPAASSPSSILSSSLDKTVRLWNIFTQTQLCVFSASSPVTALSRSKSLIVYGCENGIIGLLEYHRNKELVKQRNSFLPSDVTSEIEDSGQRSPTKDALGERKQSVFGFGEAYQILKDKKDSELDKIRRKAKKSRPVSMEVGVASQQLKMNFNDTKGDELEVFDRRSSRIRRTQEAQSSFEASVLSRQSSEIFGFGEAGNDEGEEFEHDELVQAATAKMNRPVSRALSERELVNVWDPKQKKEEDDKDVKDVLSQEKKFDAIDASALTTEDKQAAFELLVFGENPDVLNFEMQKGSNSKQMKSSTLYNSNNETDSKGGCCVVL